MPKSKMSKNSENLNYKDLENICRTCLKNCDVKFVRDHVISNVFYKLTNVHFENSDDIPQQICLKCFEKINQIHEFAFQCKRSHSSLVKCLNILKNTGINKEQDVVESSDELEIYELDENTTFDKNKCVTDISLPTNNIFYNELEKTGLPHTREKNNDPAINCSEIETEKQSNNNTIPEDLSVNVNLPNKTFSSNKNHREKGGNNPSKSKNKHSPKSNNMNAHSDKYRHKYCLRSFKYLGYLTIHKHKHTSKSPYACKLCSKSYKYSSSLVVHMRTHSGERPYKCEVCCKEFICLTNLIVHMRTHSGERPFRCKQCPKAFRRSTDLNDHKRSHSDEEPFKCEVCSKPFKYLRNLRKHTSLHNKERSFKN